MFSSQSRLPYLLIDNSVLLRDFTCIITVSMLNIAILFLPHVSIQFPLAPRSSEDCTNTIKLSNIISFLCGLRLYAYTMVKTCLLFDFID